MDFRKAKKKDIFIVFLFAWVQKTLLNKRGLGRTKLKWIQVCEEGDKSVEMWQLFTEP